MQLPFALALLVFTPASSPGQAQPPGTELQACSSRPSRGESRPSRGEPRPPCRTPGDYLRRPVPRSARFLDHGVIAVAGAGGAPHLYRLDVRVGLFDHVSVGATAHWLPGQRTPQVWPVGAIALLRWVSPGNVGVELGAHYRPVLFPPVDPESFVPQTHLALGTVVLSSGWFSAGLDLGAGHTRIPVLDPTDTESFRRRVVFAGGPFVRVGNRRVGVTGEATVVLSPTPLLVVEVALELRFGAFEDRPRGGWRSR